MLVSVIIPVYNVEQYIKECIDSVLKQTYKEIEIILVDDESKDNSGIICDEYSKKYNNISVIHKKNEGLGMARNTGLKYAKGEYVMFLDSDDYLKEDMIEVLYNLTIQKNADVCKSGFIKINDSKKVLFERNYENSEYKNDDVKNAMFTRMLGSSPSKKDSIEMCATSTLYNNDIIKKYNIQFPSERELISEDLIFNLEFFQHARNACITSYCGYYYRTNSVSLTNGYRPDRFETSKKFYNYVKNRLIELDYGEKEIYRLSRLFFIYIKIAIKQEKRAVSNMKMEKNIRNIKNICNDKLVRDILDKYPIKSLGIKQRIFLDLIKHKRAYTLYWLNNLNLI